MHLTKMASNQWTIGTESGILRKKAVKEKHEDILVFGYACKLFRDDEKALYIDQGKHLIPWMADEKLKIDRYDCRGALSEIAQFEAGREDYDTTRWLGLSESERRIEILCDEERYHSLHHNEEELEMYKEEELKRLHQKGSEVHYNYDVPPDPENSQELPEGPAEEDELFIPPVELNVPAGMEVPKTVKENVRIEKTATFISKQGLQMEILIKTKQAGNPQFSFMNKDDALYKYYKHLLSAIKSGEYKVKSTETSTEPKLDDAGEQEGQEDYYLHPSLVTTSVQLAPSPIPTVIYKPSADCAYSQLVNRIQGTQTEAATPPPPQQPPVDVPPTQLTYDQQQQYYQYYYAAQQYYEYYKQMAQLQGGQPQDKLSQDGPGLAQAPVYANQGLPEPSQFSMQEFMQNQAAYMQYFQQQSSSNPYAQIVSNLSQNKDMTYSGFTDNTNSDITKAPILYNQSEPVQNAPVQVPPPEETPPVQPEVKEEPITKPLLSLAQYGSDSEEDEEENQVKVPPGELKQIIDKMASYVLKNGKDFENIVKSKGDPRFEFLKEDHEYYPYYSLKTKTTEKIIVNDNSESKDIKEQNGKAKEKKVITPVSFSIKKPKDEVPKEIKSALPVEESDEEPSEETAKTPPIVSSPVNSTPPTITITTSSIIATSTKNHISRTPPPKDVTETTENKDLQEDCLEKTDIEDKKLDSDDLILEMIDLTDDLEEKRENKRAETRKMDKIAAVAREKLALQLERKKKAAAFLKLKSVELKPDSKTGSKSEKSKENDKRSESKHSKKDRSPRKKSRDEDEVLKVEDSESEEGEIKKHKKSSKKKKSHKRKHSSSRHSSKSRHRSKERKKSKKKRKRSGSSSSHSSVTSQ